MRVRSPTARPTERPIPRLRRRTLTPSSRALSGSEVRGVGCGRPPQAFVWFDVTERGGELTRDLVPIISTRYLGAPTPQVGDIPRMHALHMRLGGGKAKGEPGDDGGVKSHQEIDELR